jgi:hypothetical protein
MAAGIVRSRSGNLFTDWPAGSDEAFSRRGGEQQKLKRLFVATGKGAEPFANLRHQRRRRAKRGRPPPPRGDRMAVRPAARRAGPSSPAGEPVQPGGPHLQRNPCRRRPSASRGRDRPIDRVNHMRVDENPKPHDRGLPAMADLPARAHPGLPGKRGTLNAPVTNLTVVPPPSDKRTNRRRSPGQVATTAPGSGPARRDRMPASSVRRVRKSATGVLSPRVPEPGRPRQTV